MENTPDKNNRYSFPGGKIDEGESVLKALRRELKEEIGIRNFEITELVNIFERFDYKKNTGLMLLCYKTKADLSNIKLSKEHTGFRWINKKEFLEMKKDKKNFYPGIAEAIANVL